ncbi:MAG: glycine--tRNA ligase [Candidatus Aenigmarchaeota archaeon]|nr:glycine--tRNA ligase [Candidatus Aenigmarchaeota archaeon]
MEGKDRTEAILDIAKRRGFFWQNSLIHGAMAGFYDYAHLGCLLKNKWQNLWEDFFVGMDDNFYEISVCHIMPEHVFKASGHLASFVDPVVRCRKCGNTERADHIIEDNLKENFEGASLEKMTEIIKEHNIRCPKCKGPLEETGILNMMFPLNVGTGEEVRKGYLSPETAQGAYINFKLEFECLRRKLPMGLAIIGKAYRNEISPRNVLIRMREFTQAELQIFFDPDAITEHPKFHEVEDYVLRVFPAKNRESRKIDEITCKDVVKVLGMPKFYVYHMAKIQQFYLDVLKLPKELFRFRQLTDEEKAFYNKYHWDIELSLESLGGFKEVAGLHYRTDHDLAGHQKVSGESMEINIDGKKFIPHVLELSFGVDRNIYALFELALAEEQVKEEERTVMRFPRIVSPLDAGIFPLVNKDGLQEKAREIQNLLKDRGFVVFYDESGSIGRRYRRIDEIGVAAGITVDYDSLQHNDVTLRDRDSMKQIRVKIQDLPEVLKKFLNGEDLGELGKPLKQ